MLKKTWKKFSSGLLFISAAIVSGIIGNRADQEFLDRVLPFMGRTITINTNVAYLSSLIFVVLACFSCIQWYYQKKNRILENARQLLVGLNQLDDNFLLLLPILHNRLEPGDVDASAMEDALGRLVELYLAEIPKIFNGNHPEHQLDACYVVVYRPNPENDEELVYWQGYGAPSELTTTVFPLGPIVFGEKRGIPAIVFLDDEIKGAYIEYVIQDANNQWKVEHEHYRPYRNDPALKPPFEALAAIRISYEDKKFGVMCFYTKDSRVFNSDSSIKTLLSNFAQRISVAMQISTT